MKIARDGDLEIVMATIPVKSNYQNDVVSPLSTLMFSLATSLSTSQQFTIENGINESQLVANFNTSVFPELLENGLLDQFPTLSTNCQDNSFYSNQYDVNLTEFNFPGKCYLIIRFLGLKHW